MKISVKKCETGWHRWEYYENEDRTASISVCHICKEIKTQGKDEKLFKEVIKKYEL